MHRLNEISIFAIMAAYRYFMQLAYDGANYHGWQVQETASSVQDVISQALEALLSIESISLVGCGRTDAGVHASDYYAHFDLDTKLTQDAMDHLSFRLNKFLPPDISIFKVFAVPGDLHARFSATGRTYTYFIHTFKDPFLNSHSWYLYGPLDVELMNEASEVLMTYRDFTSFARLHSQTKTNICQVTAAGWHREGHRVIFTITADRFLRNMVRAVVGTMVEIGQHKMDIQKLKQVIEKLDRSEAGKSAPALGLFLSEVRYPFSG
jgi:tRNA pseudouridine38-40 synthase